MSSRSRSTAATSSRTACRARSATSSSARRSSATSWEAPLVHGLLHLRRLRPRRRDGGARARAPAHDRRAPVAVAARELQLRVRGDHPRAAHAAEPAAALPDRGARDRRRGRLRRHQDRADRAAHLDLVRARRRDAQLGHRGRRRRREHVVRPAREAGQGCRRRSGPDRVDQRGRGRLPRLLRERGGAQQPFPRPPLERTGRPDRGRARPRRSSLVIAGKASPVAAPRSAAACPRVMRPSRSRAGWRRRSSCTTPVIAS